MLPICGRFIVTGLTMEGFAQLFNHKKVTANRPVLVQVLTDQYANVIPNLPLHEAGKQKFVTDNINLLLAEDTFTVTTGHQLNIFAGPLYFIYKIVTAIKLSRQLKEAFPDKNFVPGLLDGYRRSRLCRNQLHQHWRQKSTLGFGSSRGNRSP
jgi:hypothetical protein